MNEPAIKLEERIISMFPEQETQFCQGWVLKRAEKYLWVYPLYYKFAKENIPEKIKKCEEMSRQIGIECVFRIVENTNYYLSALLTDKGYTLQRCGVVGELHLAKGEDIGQVIQTERLSLKKEDERTMIEYLIAGTDNRIGVKKQELLFWAEGSLPDDLTLQEVLQFSSKNGVTQILADFPGRKKLPEGYERVGFYRVYHYCIYQKHEDIEDESFSGIY